ncbi:MAG: GatB/YqeY domain-containing protein [Mycoplasmataceae bacterium]|nr:GatB/YqeY domain-containing protein [Mycoplasmataceae bacterium]
MRDKIINDIKEAMKSQDKEKLAVLRMVKGAMQLEEINKKQELNDEDVIAVISKQIKTRKESIVEFEKGNRSDLIEKTQAEIKILEEYMPEQLSEEEVNKIIDEAIEQVNPQAPSDMGKIMGIITPKLKGRADMSSVSKIVKEKISNRG